MVEWSYDRMVWGRRVRGRAVVRSYGPIERTYPMPLNPLRLKVTYGNQQDIPYFNKIAVYSYEKLNSNIPKYFLTEHPYFQFLTYQCTHLFYKCRDVHECFFHKKTAYKKLHS